MDGWLVALCIAHAVLTAAQSLALMQLDKRITRLQREQRANEWEADVTLPRWESVGGTGNVHRQKLGWRVRLVLWWVRIRERW